MPERPSTTRGRVGLVSMRFTLFDAQMPPDFRARQERAVARLAALLGREFEVVETGLLQSDEEARRANELLRSSGLDAVVLAPAMAAPPSHGALATEGLDAPLVLWNAPLVERLGPDLDQASAHEETTLVSAVMLANVLRRLGRPFSAVTARPDDEAGVERALRTVRAAAAAGALRGATVLRVGDPIPGYLDVAASAEQLAQLGARERAVELRELDEAYAAAEPVLARAEVERLGWRGAADERALRAAAALRLLVDATGAGCGAVNCHGPFFRGSETIGVAACLGVSLSAARGVPFSCTGDVPTALALLLARRLSGAALYGEFYSAEEATGLALFSNGGEGDAALAAGDVDVVPSAHYPGTHGSGAAVSFAIARGPATMISLTPGGEGWRLVWAAGEIVESRYPRLAAPNGMFRFASGPDGAARWIEAGPTHHQALAPGGLDLELEVVARAAGLEPVRV